MAEKAAARVRVGSEELDPKQLLEQYGESWAKAFETKSALETIARAARAPVRVQGSRRSLLVGPRLIAALPAEPDAAAAELIDRIRMLNYLEESGVHVGSNIVIQEKANKRRQLEVGVYGEEVATAIFATVVCVRDVGRTIMVTATKLAQIVGIEARWLGDEVLLLPCLAGEKWSRVVNGAASANLITPFDEVR